MSEERTEEIKVDSPRKPLEPVGDGVSDEQREVYAKLLAEYERIDGIRDTQIEGVSVSFDKDMLDDVLSEIYNEEVKPSDGEIPKELYEATRDVFEKASAGGFANGGLDVDKNKSFLKAWGRSVEVFSAFRVHKYSTMMASMLKDDDGNLRTFEEWRKATEPIQSHFNRSWLQTEYNTAVLRAEQAADWRRFEEDKDIMPNLKWMPTSSATPREEHAVFWKQGLTLPVDDKFWDERHPGDLWNCKCWLQQTDGPSTTKKEMPAKKEMPTPAKGLKSNPGKKAEMYDDSHPYYPDPKTCLWLRLAKQAKQSGAEAKTVRVVDSVNCIHNCNLCEYVQLARKGNKEANKKLYEKMKLDDNYKDVEFDEKTGGLKATHKDHNLKSEGATYELKAQEIGVKYGHSVILESELATILNKRFTEGLWDGQRFEVAGCETCEPNNILRGIRHSAHKRTTEIAIVYLCKETPIYELDRAVERYKGLPSEQFVRFKKIVFMHEDRIIHDVVL